MQNHPIKFKLLLILSLLALSNYSFATANSPVYTNGGYAVSGYDVVAYHSLRKPAKGKQLYSAKWNDATWLFISEGHQKMFMANPEKYAPQYGGHCAYAMSYNGELVKTSPDAWEIVNDKLYLNYNQIVLTIWKRQLSQNIKQADYNWKKLHSRQKI